MELKRLVDFFGIHINLRMVSSVISITLSQKDLVDINLFPSPQIHMGSNMVETWSMYGLISWRMDKRPIPARKQSRIQECHSPVGERRKGIFLASGLNACSYVLNSIVSSGSGILACGASVFNITYIIRGRKISSL